MPDPIAQGIAAKMYGPPACAICLGAREVIDTTTGGTTHCRTCLPVPVRYESRTCFGLAFFTDEADANHYAAAVVARGDRYNGGILHGMACGRDVGFDYTDPTGQPFYAVTEA